MRSKALIIVALWLPFLLSGCLKEGSDTVVMMGTESDVKEIEEVIPDTLRAFLDAKGVVLPEGNTPPDVQGVFVFYPIYMLYTNTHPVGSGNALRFRLGGNQDTLAITQDSLVLFYPEGQHNRLIPCDYLEDGLKLSSVKTAYLMGNGDSFSLYFRQEYKDIEISGVMFDLVRGVVITGDVDDEGIDGAKVAYVNIAVENIRDFTGGAISPASLKLMENNIFVYQVESGGKAVRRHWFEE